LAEGEAFCGEMSLVKGKIRRDTSSFAWDMGYGRANEKGGREKGKRVKGRERERNH
jgi:hypothetical protein